MEKKNNNKLITIIVIIVGIAIMAALIVPIATDKVENRLNNDSLKVANDSLLNVNNSLKTQVIELKTDKDSLIQVVDTVKKK